MGLLAATLSWDPQIRGMVIVLAAFTVLCGSVYLLLATNTGPRLGFLIAVTALTGWMMIMGVLWIVNVAQQGFHGHTPEWKLEQIATGPFQEQNTVEGAEGFPEGWRQLPLTDLKLSEISTAADAYAVPEAPSHGEHASAPKEREFQPPFKKVDDYVLLGVYVKGGEKYLPGGIVVERRTDKPCQGKGLIGGLQKKGCRVWRKSGFLHRPHYAVVQVQPVIEQKAVAGQAPPKPRPDPSQPVTTFVMVRDAHHPVLPWVNIRLTFISGFRALPLLFTTVVGLFFFFFCWKLHVRDKQIMALRASEPSQ